MPMIVRLHAFGGPEQLRVEELPSQRPGRGEARLRVLATGLSRDQFTFMQGHHFRGHGFVQPDLPSRIGYEACGVVDAVGDDVDPGWVGKRVAPVAPFDQNQYGVLGEEAVVPAAALCECPTNLTSAQGAAFWVSYLTAWPLVSIGRVGRGDFVSITAASSAVALAATQIARDAGAGINAVTRTSKKADHLRALGADHVVVTESEDYAARVAQITGGRGVRVTFDAIGGPFLESLAEAASPLGIIIEYGRMSGQPTPFPLFPALGKGLTIRGYTVSEVVSDPGALAEARPYIIDRLTDGRFVPQVARTFSLGQLAGAYRYIETNEQLGRVVIEMPPRQDS